MSARRTILALLLNAGALLLSVIVGSVIEYYIPAHASLYLGTIVNGALQSVLAAAILKMMLNHLGNSVKLEQYAAAYFFALQIAVIALLLEGGISTCLLYYPNFRDFYSRHLIEPMQMLTIGTLFMVFAVMRRLNKGVTCPVELTSIKTLAISFFSGILAYVMVMVAISQFS
jgi:hypothetical protein